MKICYRYFYNQKVVKEIEGLVTVFFTKKQYILFRHIYVVFIIATIVIWIKRLKQNVNIIYFVYLKNFKNTN